MVSKKSKIVLIAVATSLLTVFVVCVLVLLLNGKFSNKGCEIYPFEVDPHPLIVLTGTSSFLYPIWGEKTLKFSSDRSVDFICPGQSILLGSTQTNDSLLTGKCVSGSTFKIGNKQIDWTELRCSQPLWRSIRATGNTCAEDGRELEAGFDVIDGRFLRTLLICFNPALQIAYYTYINQTASINQRVLSTPRPSWLQGSGIYSVGTVTNLYLRNNQKATINRLLGLPDNSTEYIMDTGNYFLARGHMTARSDNFYAAQQNVTFYMQNIAPQWQTFNGFNWNQVEIDVRDYAEEKGVDLQVWTGVHGVTTLNHTVTGNPVELYLFVNDTTKLIPVPEIFWKVAYDPATEKGVALIGVNNPYNSTFAPLCQDISSRITWLHCDKRNQQSGFCYACSITHLRQVVRSIPNISDRGLLL